MRPSIIRKQKIVEELVTLISSGNTVAIASIEGVPASLMQKVRKELAGKAKIKVAKNNLIKRALDAAKEKKKGIEKLLNYMEGPTAVIVSNMDPFELYKLLRKLKENAPLRPGQIVEEDVVVKPGPTGLPAMMIGEIKAAGIPVRLNKGVVEGEKEFVAVKAGERVDAKLANALAKIGVTPVELWVRIRAIYSDGIIFPADVLAVDVEKVKTDIIRAHAHALNLAVHAGYPTKESMPILIAKAYTHALNLAVHAGYVTKESARYILARAYSRMLALASRLPAEALDEELQKKLSVQVRPTEEQKEGKEEKEEEEKQEEGAKEEEAAAGLASLFG